MPQKNPIKQLFHATFGFAIKERAWRKLIFALSLILTIVVLVINFSSLKQGAVALVEGNWLLISLSFIAVAITYFTAAGVYWSLADRKIKYLQMVEVELAGAFTSRLLPAGLGGVATNIKYISGVMKSKTQATTIVALNNIVSVLSYIFVGLCMIVFTHQSLRSVLRFDVPKAPLFFLFGIFVVSILMLSFIRQVRERIGLSLQKFINLMKAYRDRPQQLLASFVSALGTTIFYLLAFFLCTRALGQPITLTQAFVAFTFGMTGSTLAPTPGGIGGAELGYYSGLYASGVPAPEALSIVLVYRLIAFWIPLIPGFFMFRHLLSKKIL